MEENPNMIESLLEKATDYAKTSYELVKLKALDKTADVVSTIIPHSIVLILVVTFMVFLNLGVALWLGEILGKTYLGFFIVTAFYGIAGIVLHFFLHNWIKKIIKEYIIKLGFK